MSKSSNQIALNTHLQFLVIFFAIFIGLSVLGLIEQEVWMAIGFGIVTLAPLFVFLISPMYYVFSKESVEIIYLWGQKEEIKWTSIRSITLEGSWLSRGDSPPHYQIAYPTAQKRKFFMNGEVSKTIKTRKLINRYYKKDIMQSVFYPV